MHEARFDWRKLGGLFVLISLLLAWRFPDPLLKPWSLIWEEGTVYFEQSYNLPFWQAVFTPYAGYCTVVTRLLAGACLWLPYGAIPFAYTFLSWMCAAAVLSFFYLPHFRSTVASDWKRGAICVALCAAPNAIPLMHLETLPFFLVVLLALIGLMELPSGLAGKCAVAVIAALSAWSAPMAVALAPVFLYRAIQKGAPARDRTVWVSILAAIGGYAIVTRLFGKANIEINFAHLPSEYWHSLAYRFAAVGIIGESPATRLVSRFGWYGALPFLLVIVFPVALGLAKGWIRGHAVFVTLTLFWCIFATVLMIGLRPDWSNYFFQFQPAYTYWMQDRYFFPATVFLFLFLGVLWSGLRDRLMLPVGIAAGCWCLSMYFWGYAFHPWTDWGNKFLPYTKQLEALEREAAADGKIHKFIIPIAPRSFLMTLEVGKNKHAHGIQQEIAPSTQKLTDFFELDEDRPGQRHSVWFGAFDDSKYPWIHHRTYGWMIFLRAEGGGFWFWSKDLEYFWSAPWEFPRVFLLKTKGWMYLQQAPYSTAGH